MCEALNVFIDDIFNDLFLDGTDPFIILNIRDYCVAHSQSNSKDTAIIAWSLWCALRRGLEARQPVN